MKAIKGFLGVFAKILIMISPMLAGALWLYAGVAAWKDLGWMGLLAWEIPTLSVVLYLAWSAYSSTHQMIAMSDLTQEEMVEKYQEHTLSVFVGPSFLFGMVGMAISSAVGRSRILKVISWLAMGMLALEAAVAIFASWVGAGILLGAPFGVVGIGLGMVAPMLLFFHWSFEADKLRKLHPECVGGS